MRNVGEQKQTTLKHYAQTMEKTSFQKDSVKTKVLCEWPCFCITRNTTSITKHTKIIMQKYDLKIITTALPPKNLGIF